MLGLLGLAVDALDDDLLSAFIPEQQAFMELPGNIVYALVVAQNPLGYSRADLAD